MRSQIAMLGAATALLSCCLQPAHAGIDDICVQITVSGVVNTTIGHCEPSGLNTNEVKTGTGKPEILWVDVVVRLP